MRWLRYARRWEVWVVAAVLIAVVLGIIQSHGCESSSTLWAIPADFKPDPDPAGLAQGMIDPKNGGVVALADGARIEARQATVKERISARIARLRNSPGTLGCKSVVSSVYEFSLGDDRKTQPEEAVRVTVPFPPGTSAEGLALAHWNGIQWQAIPSTVNPEKGFASANVGHLSDFAVVNSTKFIRQPATLVLNPSADDKDSIQLLPRGATIDAIIVESPAHPTVKYTTIECPGDEEMQFLDEQNKFSTIGSVLDSPGQAYSLVRFTLRLSKNARLGTRDLWLRGPGGTHRYRNAFAVCRPLVVIVDIDGMRQDVFYEELEDELSTCHTLQKLVGKKVKSIKPWTEFENALAMHDAVTVFPTVTFAGHAGIFSGCDPGALRMAGNEWFDRKKLPSPYKYAFTGDNLGVSGLGDSHNSYMNGFANARLLESGKTTVYQDAFKELGATSSVFHNMYFGDGKKAAEWNSYWVTDEVLWYGPLHSHWMLTQFADRNMGRKARNLIRAHDRNQGDDPQNLGIVTLYYAGLDHLGHEWHHPSFVEGRHRDYLRSVIDPSLGSLVETMSEATFKSATFVITADHGQTNMSVPRGKEGDEIHCFAVPRRVSYLHKFADLLYEWGYLPLGRYRNEEPLGELTPDLSTAIVGLNGGMAHVYLRCKRGGGLLRPRPRRTPDVPSMDEIFSVEKNFNSWFTAASFDQVLQVAVNFWQWNTQGLPTVGEREDNEPPEYRNSLDLILVRNVERDGDEAPYFVFERPGRLTPFKDYLLAHGNAPFTEERYGWTSSREDIEFLADRLSRLSSWVSGDLILIPRYPEFYCEYKPLYGDHGGLARTDFQVPFLVARAGAFDPREEFRNVILKSVDLKTKQRPAVTDVKETVLNLLRAPSEAPPPLPTPASVTLDPPKLRRSEQSKVYMAKDHPHFRQGRAVYEGEELEFTVTYTLSNADRELVPAAFIEGQRVSTPDGPHTFGLVEASPVNFDMAGKHTLVYRFPAPPVDTLKAYSFALLRANAKVAETPPVMVAAYPRGWALSEVLTDPKPDFDNPKVGTWKWIQAKHEEGILTVTREEAVSGARRVETLAITGIPAFIIDSGSTKLTLKRSLSFEGRAQVDIVPLVGVSGVLYDDPKRSGIALRETGEKTAEPRSIDFRIGPRDLSVRSLDLELIFKEQGTMMQVGSKPLRLTVVLRYVRP